MNFGLRKERMGPTNLKGVAMENAGIARLNGTSGRARTEGVEGADGAPGLSFTGRIANWSARHRWWVVTASALFIVLAMFISNTIGMEILDDEGIEGEAAVGADLVQERFDVVAVPTEQLVFSNPSLSVDDPVFRSTVEGLVQQLRALPEVQSVASYYDTQDPNMVSDDGSVLLAQLVIEGDTDDALDKIDPIQDKVHAAAESASGFEIVMAGTTSIDQQLEEIEKEDFGTMIMITMVLALVLMLIAFRSVVAATIPLIMALGAIFSAIGVATLVSHVYPMPEFLAQVVLLMGMAVGVDYSLFIVSRYRSEREAGRPKLEAITVACNTTGRAVFYAGVTVLLSLAGLMLTDSAIFASMAIGVIIVVSLALVASLTLLPAMLAVLGDNVNRLRLPIIGRDSKENNGGGIWGAITDKVLARPGILATVTAAALIALAVPVLSLDMGFGTGSDNYHDAVEGKRALQLLEENFTSGLAAPAYVIVDAPDVNSANVQASVARLVEAVARDDAFSPPFDIQVNGAGDLLYVQVPLVGGTDETVSENAVKHLRQDIIPPAFAGSDVQVYVSGATASSLDTTDHMNKAVPYVFGFVLGLAFLLLLVMFRSIVIPVKAIALNLLSVGAAYGVMVMVFQWGWGIGILGSEATGVIAPWLPLFMFAILFGLSMDYHMLLLSRIKEAYDQGYSNEESVSRGIKVTAGQITSAAAIMVGIFFTFALGRQIFAQQMGVGLGVAVLIDATVIRTVLLPASMKLLGDRNWYLPSWLDWLPKVGSDEGRQHDAAAPQPVPSVSGD